MDLKVGATFESDSHAVVVIEPHFEGNDGADVRFSVVLSGRWSGATLYNDVDNFKGIRAERASGRVTFSADTKRDFSETSLVEAHLAAADLQTANFRQADLSAVLAYDYGGSGANPTSLRGATLDRARLLRADVRGADLSYAHVEGADFAGAVLENATFANVVWDFTTKWPPGFTPPNRRSS